MIYRKSLSEPIFEGPIHSEKRPDSKRSIKRKLNTKRDSFWGKFMREIDHLEENRRSKRASRTNEAFKHDYRGKRDGFSGTAGVDFPYLHRKLFSSAKGCSGNECCRLYPGECLIIDQCDCPGVEVCKKVQDQNRYCHVCPECITGIE